MYSRSKMVDLAKSWIGKNVKDGSYKEIIDIYNSFGSLPRNLKMQYGWAWCACTWSALAIKLGYTSIIPIEISCGELIKKARDKKCWVEDDDYVPLPGDAILYDWDDNGVGDNTGWPDHVGIVVYVNKKTGYMEVVEGNYNGSVKKRTISINGRYIRGFITPKYDDNAIISQESDTSVKKTIAEVAREVILGKWSIGENRKKLLVAAGYDYAEVQKAVSQILNSSVVSTTNPNQDQNQPISKKVKANCIARIYNPKIKGTYTTSDNVYCRHDAGDNKKAMCKIPAGLRVQCYGYYNVADDKMWLYVQFIMDGVQYTGFCPSELLRKE